MPNEIDRTSSAQRRSSKLLTAMAIFICLGIAAYMVLTLLVNRQTPATPDTHYTGTNGVSVYYDSSVWSVCRMTEDATLGTVLELATADTADSEDYQAVLLQRGTADSYESFIEAAQQAGADVAVFGHTHRPVCERIGPMWLVNPGALALGCFGYVQAAFADITPSRVLCPAEKLSYKR